MLKVLIIKKSDILAGIYFIFLKGIPRPNLKNLDLTEKVKKVVIK